MYPEPGDSCTLAVLDDDMALITLGGELEWDEAQEVASEIGHDLDEHDCDEVDDPRIKCGCGCRLRRDRAVTDEQARFQSVR